MHKPLYISRPVMMGWQICAWAERVGISNVLREGDLHVTVAMSRAAVDWPEPANDFITMPAPDWTLKAFTTGTGTNAAVLAFENDTLRARWEQIIALGGSWDFPDYTPHVSLSYNTEPWTDDLKYEGFLILGPEKVTEYIENWRPSA